MIWGPHAQRRDRAMRGFRPLDRRRRFSGPARFARGLYYPWPGILKQINVMRAGDPGSSPG